MIMKHQKYLIVSVYILLFIALGISGCATSMPLTKNTTELNITKKSITIMSLKISNKYVPSYQPNVRIVTILQNGRTSAKVRVEETYNKVEGEFNEYLLSFQLSPGRHKIGEIMGGSGIFPFVGHFKFPMDAEFELASNTITYIGHVEMVNRERKNGEPRSGGIFPLLDQAATGFSGGTFDITVSDNYVKDINYFKDKYPSIGEYEIKSNIAVLSKPK